MTTSGTPKRSTSGESEQTNTTIRLQTPAEALALLGENDTNLKRLRERLQVRIIARGDAIQLSGTPQDVAKAEQLVRDLLAIVRHGGEIDVEDIERGVLGNGSPEEIDLELPKRLRPKTRGQHAYVQAISTSDITFGIGPAGTGKTYLAVAMAVAAFKSKQVKRIVLTRPAVEAGERLGFLPGDLQAKIDPYLRPLYDALFEMIDADRFESYLSSGTIEVAPLAFMRGRTLNNAFIILDEAQNTTPEQMKMFLTRMGFSSKVVVTGDITQVDLPKNVTSGLIEAQRILHDIDGISFVRFTDSDVVRHSLVGRIIRAYEEHS